MKITVQDVDIYYQITKCVLSAIILIRMNNWTID